MPRLSPPPSSFGGFSPRSHDLGLFFAFFSLYVLKWHCCATATQNETFRCAYYKHGDSLVTGGADNINASIVHRDFVISPQLWESFTWFYICIVAFMVGGLIVVSERWHGKLTGDTDLNKPQASHSRSTPRVGGLAVVAGSLAGLLVLGPSNMTLTWLWPVLFIAVMPVFVAGLLEDLTKDIGAGKRLLAAFLSAAIAWW